MFFRSLCAVALASSACVDQPVVIDGAQTLSQLGLFTDVAALAPSAGVYPYDVSVPLYSDGASKQRFVRVPPGTQITTGDDRWTLPNGTLLVKTFLFPTLGGGETRIETRVIEQTPDGLLEATYRWNDEQTDATVSGGNEDVPVVWDDAAGRHMQTFHVPGTSQCQTCHETGSTSHALGWRTRQLAVSGQIQRFLAAGIIDAAPTDPEALPDPTGIAPLADRAQAYLDVNCGSCHNEDGYAAGTVLFDLGHATGNICRPTATVSGTHRVIVPGHPERSELLARMESTDPYVRMPYGSNHIPDSTGITVISEWIASLPEQECP